MTLNKVLSLLLLPLSLALNACAEPLKVGAPAPLASGTTNSGATLSLADVYAKHTYTLVFFYPKAGTGGCTAQGCSLRDAFEDLSAKGVAVIGVSTDNREAQQAFSEANHFPFPLIADTEQVFVKAFGVPALGGFAKRQAFLIKAGRVLWADHSASTKEQAADVLKAIAADQPAK